jgi:23S rRNA (uracil1939-C5)-methyltransferase
MRRRTRPVPKGVFPAHVDSYAHDGRGVARVEGRAVFIEGALPGEDVEFSYSEVHRDYAEGRAVAVVLKPSPDRVEPRCPHYALCGGCSLQHLAEAAQIEEKQRIMAEQLRRIGKLEDAPLWEPLRGPLWGYRRKARLSVKNVPKKGRVLVGFHERTGPFVADLDACLVLHPAIGQRLRDLSELIGGLSLKHRLPQIEVSMGDERAALVFRALEDPTADDLARFREFGARFGFDIWLQRHGPDSMAPIYPEHPEPLSYALPEFGLEYRFQPTEFTQVNGEINRRMVSRVLEVLAPQPDEAVLDLFCGLGNFTLALARGAESVTGVEGGAALVERARANAALNGVNNVEFHLADLSQPLDGQPWAKRRYHKVLLDPARGGAEEVLAYVPDWGASRIVYVSCNPSTLARDAGILVHRHGYRLAGAGVMDMFPQTAHVESIALFEK